MNEFENLKCAIKKMLIKNKQAFSKHNIEYFLFDYLWYLLIKNKLSSNGFCFNTDNVEEEYIKVIESGDENAIELLSQMLEQKDKIDKVFNEIKSILDLEKKTENAQTTTELCEFIKKDYKQ